MRGERVGVLVCGLICESWILPGTVGIARWWLPWLLLVLVIILLALPCAHRETYQAHERRIAAEILERSHDV